MELKAATTNSHMTLVICTRRKLKESARKGEAGMNVIGPLNGTIALIKGTNGGFEFIALITGQSILTARKLKRKMSKLMWKLSQNTTSGILILSQRSWRRKCGLIRLWLVIHPCTLLPC